MTEFSFSTASSIGPNTLERWREALRRAFGPIEANPIEGRIFEGAIRVNRCANLQFNEVFYCGQTIERTAQNLADSNQEFFTFGIPMAGPLYVTQKNRSFIVQPDCVVLANQSAPYKATSTEGYRAFSMSIPSSLLMKRKSDIQSFYSLSNQSVSAELLSHFVKKIHEGIPNWSALEVSSLRDQMLDLIVLLMTGRNDRWTTSSESSVKAAHRERVINFVKRYHRDAALSPEAVAVACGISVNYLHRIFRCEDLHVTDLIYAQRLETAKNMLLDPANIEKTVQQIAYHSGFNHVSHFSRMFKEKFGATPSECRGSSTLVANVGSVGKSNV